MTLHTSKLKPLSLLSINILQVTISKQQRSKKFLWPPIKTLWVKTIPAQPLQAVGEKTIVPVLTCNTLYPDIGRQEDFDLIHCKHN